MFKEIFLDLLHEKGLNQRTFGLQAGIPVTTISGWINANRLPDYNAIKKIAEFFEVSTDYLLGLEDDFGATTFQSGGAPALVGQDKELLELFHELSPDYRETALNALRAMTGTPTRSTSKKRG